jgi:hypothetical protein
MSIEKQVYCEIIAQETPKVLRNCHTCKKTMEFYCSEKFRVNAQQKNIDVWLIYKCFQCASTWNYPILSRVHTGSINKELHKKFMSNDREVAWIYAFQIEELKKLCGGVNTDIEYLIVGEQIDVEVESVMIHLSSKYKFDLRLDKVLKEILDISRSKLYQMEDRGRIAINPQVGVKSKVKEDLLISIVKECFNL